MANRTLTILTLLCAIGFAWSFTMAQTEKGDESNGNIAILRQQRIQLLKERVSKVQEFHDAELVDRSELIDPQIDLINAKLDYAKSNIEKKQLLTSLMKLYDEKIQLAELALQAPRLPVKAGERARPHGLDEMSTILFLKSERIRIEIERDSLD